MKAQPKRILIFVHGYNTSFCDALAAQSIIRAKLQAMGWDGIIIGLDWPSWAGVLGNVAGAVAYPNDSMNARRSARHLVRCLYASAFNDPHFHSLFLSRLLS